MLSPKKSAIQKNSSTQQQNTTKPDKNAPPQSDDIQRALADPSEHTLTPTVLNHIQRQYGNRAALDLVNRAHNTDNHYVGPANDPHEHQAEQQSRHVMQTLGQPVNPSVQRTSTSDSLGGTHVSDAIQRDIDRTRGKGQGLDGNVRTDMESAFGTSFSDVTIHQDTRADQLSRSLQAKAFTVGSDIYFRKNAYNPASNDGQALLAHELTHVNQQRGGGLPAPNAGIQRLLVIQRTLDTIGGTWDWPKFNTVDEGAGKLGAEIELEFMPNNMVDSKKVALVQKVKKVVNGENLDKKKRDEGLDKQFGAAKTAYSRTTDQGEGHWDRALTSTNPVYGASDLAQGEDISKTPASTMDMSQEAMTAGTASNYQLGHRYNTWFLRRNKVRAAKLYDKPNFNAAGGSKMIFETAAMSIKGGQKGTYYGSVEWGWRIPNGSDTVQLIPVRVISMGTPSQNMKDLADVWNNNPTYLNGGANQVDNTAVPETSYTSLANTIDLDNLGAVQGAIQQIEGMIGGLAGNDKKNAKLELKFLKAKAENLQGG